MAAEIFRNAEGSVLIRYNCREIPMRKIAETLSLAGLVMLLAMTMLALYGRERLPDYIPTHFNAAGQADGWGSPQALLVFPAIGAALYLLTSWAARHPVAFNFPVRVTPRNRPQLEAVALSMIVWIKAEVLCILAGVEWGAIRAARHPEQRLTPLLMPALLAVVFATVIGHVAAIFRTGNAARRS